MEKMHLDDFNLKQLDHLHAKSIKLVSPINRVVFRAPVVPNEVMLGVYAKWINSRIESARKHHVAIHVDVLLIHQPSFAELERKINEHNRDA